MGFVPNDVDVTLSNWSDLFLSAVDEHVLKCNATNLSDHPWIDTELLSLVKKKNRQRKKAKKTGLHNDLIRFKDLRHETKQLILRKKKDLAQKLRESMLYNPKRFWSFVKTTTKQSISPKFLREGQSFLTDSTSKANMLNMFFQSVSEVWSHLLGSLPRYQALFYPAFSCPSLK